MYLDLTLIQKINEERLREVRLQKQLNWSLGKCSQMKCLKEANADIIILGEQSTSNLNPCKASGQLTARTRELF